MLYGLECAGLVLLSLSCVLFTHIAIVIARLLLLLLQFVVVAILLLGKQIVATTASITPKCQ